MNLVFVTADRLAAGGGKATRIELLTNELSKRGYAVFVVEPRRESHLDHLKNAVLKAIALFDKEIMVYYAYCLRVAAMRDRVSSFLAVERPRGRIILDCQDPISTEAVLTLKEKLPKQTVIVSTVHSASGAVREMTQNGLLREGSRVQRSLMAREARSLRSARVVVLVNKCGCEVIEQTTGATNLVTIYGGVDELDLPPRLLSKVKSMVARFANGLPVIACIVTLRRVKGVDLLIRALARLRQQNILLKCVITGEGSEGTFLRSLATELGIADYVFFVGRLSRIQVFSVLKCALFSVQPSRDEGFPTAILEAMAAGRPTVAFRVGGIPELVIDGLTGVLAERENVEDLACKILYLLENPTLRDSCGREARRRYLECFTVDRMVERYEQFYWSLAR